MTENTKPIDPVEEKEKRREKEKDAVRKTVEDAAKAHADLGEKFKKEDEEERIKKEKETEKKEEKK